MPTPAIDQAPHLVTVSGNEWPLWRWVCLRSAGFPAEAIFKLTASQDAISAADQVNDAIRTMEFSQRRLLQQIHSALDELRSNGLWDDKRKRKPLLEAVSKIKAGKVPSSLAECIPFEVIQEFRASIRRVETSRATFHEMFKKAREDTSQAIREIANLPEFREALTWQNRAAVKTALDSLLRNHEKPGTRDSAQKQHEELVASYWQRYCTKNDTIGFFGPVGWARIVPEIGHLIARHGTQLVAFRKTYWESWAIEALAAAIARKYNLQPWIAPFLVPYVRVEGTVLYHPLFGGLRLTAKQAALLQACNGRDSAKHIAGKLQRLPLLKFQGAAEVYDGLREMVTKGFVYWKFNIPLGPHPEHVLRQALERIDEVNIRKRSLDCLDEFDSARAYVEESAGNPDKLNLAFQNLEQVFTRLTGLPATRNQGKVYAGRTLVYEDCRRDVEVLICEEWLKDLVDPLSLLLATGRWFTSRVAEVYKSKFLQVYSEIVRATGNPIVDATLCWGKAAEFLFDKSPVLMSPLQEEFRSKWERILQLGEGREPVVYTCDELRSRILQEFPPSEPGWTGARYHSPDIMIAAASEEAIRKGDYLFVMGEVHVSANTLQASLFANQHTSPKELVDAVEHDLGISNVVPVGPKGEDTGSRTVQSLIPKSNFRLEYVADSFVMDRSKALPVSSLVLEKHQGELIAKTRDGRFRMNVIDLVGGLLSVLAIDCFRIMAPRRHSPRISIDRLVIKRESWRFSPSELQFAQCSDSSERFLQARSWAQAEGIPRCVFFKVPVERKPTYLDFGSPILVDVFAKMIRRTLDAALPDSSVDISEMLPSHNQAWLKDVENRRYMSEFRFVAVDQTPRR